MAIALSAHTPWVQVVSTVSGLGARTSIQAHLVIAWPTISFKVLSKPWHGSSNTCKWEKPPVQSMGSAPDHSLYQRTPVRASLSLYSNRDQRYAAAVTELRPCCYRTVYALPMALSRNLGQANRPIIRGPVYTALAAKRTAAYSSQVEKSFST